MWVLEYLGLQVLDDSIPELASKTQILEMS